MHTISKLVAYFADNAFDAHHSLHLTIETRLSTDYPSRLSKILPQSRSGRSAVTVKLSVDITSEQTAATTI